MMTLAATAIAEPALLPRTAPASGDAEFLTIGIDVGGTKMACVVTDAADHVLHRDVEPTDTRRLTEQIGAMASSARAAVTDKDERRAVAIGVAIPGQVQPRRGTSELAVNLGAPGIDLARTVSSHANLPCFVEHDARAAATWVYRRSGNGADLCYLSVGTGIAAGIILGGRPLRGESGLAGEVGHTIVDPNGRLCPCGSTGCLETVAAGPAIARAAREGVAANRATSLTSEATAADVFIAADNGDELAQEIAADVATHLARALRGLVLTLGLQRIVIGGGVAGSGDALRNPILAALSEERAASPLVETAFAEASIELLPPDLEPGARGAAFIARQRVRALEREEVASTR
jgi:glucokinase